MTPGAISLAEQLAPLAARLRKTHAVVRPISQSLIQLDAATNPAAFVDALKVILPWVNDRAGQPLPQEAWEGKTFELEEVGAQRTSAVAIDEPRYWAARLDDSDKDVPQRNWVNEITVAQRNDREVLVGTRLLCVTRGDDVPFQPSLQRFVRTLVEKIPGCRVEGREVSIDPWFVRRESDVYELVDLMRDDSRRLDLIVCSLPEGSENPTDAAIDAVNFHRKTLGAAHVAILSSNASYALTDAVGKEFSVFRAAIRTYRPGFNDTEDEPYSHPLIMGDRVKAFLPNGAVDFQNFLIGQTLIRSATGSDADRYFPPFSQVKRVAAELRMKRAKERGTSQKDLLALAEEEIRELREAAQKDKEVYEGLVAQYEQDAQQSQEEAQQARASNLNLQARIRALEAQQASSVEIEARSIPPTLDQFEDWCRNELAGAVEVLNRAFSGVKKSQLEDVALIYEALLLLKDHYVPMRREGGIDRKNAFESRCQTLGLADEPTFSGERWGEQGDEYKVRYGGRGRLLDRHLKKGNSKDQRHCFRLYYFWDDETEQVVVGWLPSHLDTRKT